MLKIQSQESRELDDTEGEMIEVINTGVCWGCCLCSHITQKTTTTDPRLAFAVNDNSRAGEFRQKFDGSSTALQVLRGRDLSGCHVIVTGANSGIGEHKPRDVFHSV